MILYHVQIEQNSAVYVLVTKRNPEIIVINPSVCEVSAPIHSDITRQMNHFVGVDNKIGVKHYTGNTVATLYTLVAFITPGLTHTHCMISKHSCLSKEL